jgi:hypothetical protein
MSTTRRRSRVPPELIFGPEFFVVERAEGMLVAGLVYKR